MKQCRHYGRYLDVYTDVSDRELQSLYQNVAGLIFASSIEGFGLPLVEALQQGLPVIASDIPVFREIGGQYPTYFRDGDVEDLMKVLKAFPTTPKQDLEGFHWRSWDEAIKELVPLCLAIQQAAQPDE
jgi:alpha-1,2-rhamnosyltransferase